MARIVVSSYLRRLIDSTFHILDPYRGKNNGRLKTISKGYTNLIWDEEYI